MHPPKRHVPIHSSSTCHLCIYNARSLYLHQIVNSRSRWVLDNGTVTGYVTLGDGPDKYQRGNGQKQGTVRDRVFEPLQLPARLSLRCALEPIRVSLIGSRKVARVDAFQSASGNIWPLLSPLVAIIAAGSAKSLSSQQRTGPIHHRVPERTTIVRKRSYSVSVRGRDRRHAYYFADTCVRPWGESERDRIMHETLRKHQGKDACQ